MKSFLKNLFGCRTKNMLPPPAAPSPAQPEPIEVFQERPLEDFFRVVEVSDAELFASSLFKRRFNCDTFPSTPKHFVALYQQPDGLIRNLGYVHFEIWKNNALGGGMVIDERAWRHMPAADRQKIRALGGVAETLLRGAIRQLPQELIGIWGYVGDPLALKVDLRVGFQQTHHEHVVVIWRNVDEEEKEIWLQRVIDYGPF